MQKGFIHDLAETLPQRQTNAEARYKAERDKFYKDLEAKGINTSVGTLAEIPKIPLWKVIASAVKRTRAVKRR